MYGGREFFQSPLCSLLTHKSSKELSGCNQTFLISDKNNVLSEVLEVINGPVMLILWHLDWFHGLWTKQNIWFFDYKEKSNNASL